MTLNNKMMHLSCSFGRTTATITATTTGTTTKTTTYIPTEKAATAKKHLNNKDKLDVSREKKKKKKKKMIKRNGDMVKCISCKSSLL